MQTTQNPEFGFYGAFNQLGLSDSAWAAATSLLLRETGSCPEEVRAFLDSTTGRHFADSVFNHLSSPNHIREAVLAAIAEWQRWRRREDRGMDYLDARILEAAHYAELETA